MSKFYPFEQLKTPTFVCELPLQTTPAQDQALTIRLEAARQFYNACLGEGLKILRCMRDTRAWQAARLLPKGKARSQRFRKIITQYDFTWASLDRFAIACKNACWIGHHLGPHETQVIAERAFSAVEQCALGKKGRPRFKGKRGLRSIEGKSNKAGIRWREHRVEWDGLCLPAIFDRKDKHGWQRAALAAKTKFCRILRRTIRGRDRWFVQLVQDGIAPRKTQHTVGKDTVGLDLGPSTIAIVSGTEAILQPLCPTVTQPWAESRRLQRAMDRSRRATNPKNFQGDQTAMKGPKTWAKSSRYRTLASRHSEIECRLAAERKRAHGELANRVLALGSQIRTEDLSYKALQRMFGWSIKICAPRKFLDLVCRKAVSAGGGLAEFPTRTTRLSQVCHGCGGYMKKPLSLRIHTCACGIGPVQRDLYSAFLARFVHDDHLDVRQAHDAWPAAEPLLRRAGSRDVQPASGSRSLGPHARNGVRAGRPSKRTGPADETAHSPLGPNPEKGREEPA